jgi:hypothetical protein
MTKKSLLATAAAVALLAGTNLAPAQNTSQGSEPKASSAPMKAQDKPDMKSTVQPSSAQKTPESSTKPTQSTQAPADAGKAKSETTGQAAPNTQPAQRSAPSSTQSPTSTQSQPGTTAPAQAPATTTQAPASGTTTTQGQTGAQTGASVSLTPQQRTEIQSTVLASAPKVSDVNFSLNVGTVVPRTVRIVEVHPTLVKIYPQWRGHMYFVVGDRIIIVERNTLRIVAVITV